MPKIHGPDMAEAGFWLGVRVLCELAAMSFRFRGRARK